MHPEQETNTHLPSRTLRAASPDSGAPVPVEAAEKGIVMLTSSDGAIDELPGVLESLRLFSVFDEAKLTGFPSAFASIAETTSESSG